MKRIVLAVLATAILGIMFMGCTPEATARWQKDQESQYNGGLERVLTVYGLQGQIVAQYKGKFDIDQEQDKGKIKFDDTSGNDRVRHIIFYGDNNVVTIDEVSE